MMENNTATEDDTIPVGILVPSLILITIMTLMAIVGNLLVVIVYLKDSKLQTVHNFYIFNLAVTDLLIGLISMPFYAVYTALSWSWPFGKAFCKIYMVCDFTLCIQSVLMVMLISLDRLMLVTLGAEYHVKETMKVARIKTAICCIVSFILYSPAIIAWDFWTGTSHVEEGDCDVEFFNNLEYTLVTSLIEFVVPFLSITILSVLVYIKIRSRLKARDRSKSSSSVNVIAPSSPQTEGLRAINSISKGVTQDKSKALVKVSCTKKYKHTEVKAAKALTVLVAVMAICWIPYTVSTVVVAVCVNCISNNVYEMLNWLLWFKASVNPFLYAFRSERFKENTMKMLPLRFVARK